MIIAHAWTDQYATGDQIITRLGRENMGTLWARFTASSVFVTLLEFLSAGNQSALVNAAEWRRPVLEVFIQDDAEHSQAAQEFVKKTYGRRQGLSIVFRDVTASERDLTRFRKLADHFGYADPRLPAFYVSGQFESGWNASTTPIRLDEALTVEVFTRKGCPRCAAAKPILFETLASRYPVHRFVERDIANAQSQKRLSELSQRYRVQATSVPAVHACGRLMVGFIDAPTSFRQWDDVLRAVTIPAPENEVAPKPLSSSLDSRQRPRGNFNLLESALYAGEPPKNGSAPSSNVPAPIPIEKNTTEGPGEQSLSSSSPIEPDEAELLPLPQQPASTIPEVIELPWLGPVHWRYWGFPAFTFAVGLIDGFNPCAMWVLLFLLSMLVNLHDRWKILAVAGTFVFISGAAYYAFMSAWLSVFVFIGLLRPAQITLGLIGITMGGIHVKDYFAFKQGVSLSIPESAKPGIYARIRQVVLAKTLWAAIVGASVVAVLVNFIELLCTAGLPAMYTAILSAQQWHWLYNQLYLLLYIIAYMFDDTIMLAMVVITLDRYKLQERGGRILKLVSGLAILALGLVMLLRPEWLV